jgi:hypothetical protein
MISYSSYGLLLIFILRKFTMLSKYKRHMKEWVLILHMGYCLYLYWENSRRYRNINVIWKNDFLFFIWVIAYITTNQFSLFIVIVILDGGHCDRYILYVLAVPLQAWSGPEGSRKLRFPDYMTTARDGGKFVSLTHRPPLPPGNATGAHFC